jgi:hypothetical protein
MTTVVSTRMPSTLERAVRFHADRSGMLVPVIVRLILEHALRGRYNFSGLPDAQELLGAKLDIRISDDLNLNLRAETERLGVSPSVYIRKILYAYYTKRLIFIEKDGRYTLEENYDQKKSA